jgi:hypothetical protein
VRTCDVRTCDVRTCHVRTCDVPACDVRTCDVPTCDGRTCDVPRAMCVVLLWVVLSAGGAVAFGEERYALIVAGASGGQEYAQQYGKWTDALSKLLASQMKIDAANLMVLSDTPRPDAAATDANVRKAMAKLRAAVQRDDVLLVVLIGHGTFDGVDAKFNLVGPDLGSTAWAELVEGISGRVVVVNTTSASFPFIEGLSGPRRVIITATDSAAQRFDTVFPEYFIGAFQQDTADVDKNGRVSLWEAFAAAAAGVRRHYQQRGQLATERPLLDDNGDGVGNEASHPGEDGALASRTYLDEPIPGAAPTDPQLVKLLQRKAALEAEVEELRVRRTFIPAAEYAQEFEKLMIELAQVSHEVRKRIGSS